MARSPIAVELKTTVGDQEVIDAPRSCGAVTGLRLGELLAFCWQDFVGRFASRQAFILGVVGFRYQHCGKQETDSVLTEIAGLLAGPLAGTLGGLRSFVSQISECRVNQQVELVVIAPVIGKHVDPLATFQGCFHRRILQAGTAAPSHLAQE